MSLEAALLTAVAGLVTCIVFLFGFFMRRQDKAHQATTTLYRKQCEDDRAAFEARLAKADSKWDDAVKRIRALEDARVNDERAHGHELKGMANELLKDAAANREANRQIAEDNRRILRELIDSINRWRETGDLPSPHDLPRVSTETIIRNGHG